VANQDCGPFASLNECIQFSGALKDRSFRFAQPQSLMHLALEAVQVKRAYDFVGRAGMSLDLNSRVAQSKTDAPALCIRFRMKIGHEDIATRFGHPPQFDRYRFQVVKMSRSK
jgi:hypothetical protein